MREEKEASRRPNMQIVGISEGDKVIAEIFLEHSSHLQIERAHQLCSRIGEAGTGHIPK